MASLTIVLGKTTHEGIKGSVELEVIDFHRNNTKFQQNINGKTVRFGLSLAEYYKLFGNSHEILTTNPYTEEDYKLSLAPWQGQDPENTFLQLLWKFVIEDDIRPGHPSYPKKTLSPL